MSGTVDRLTRVNAIMKREIAEYLESGVAMLPEGVLVSVVEVNCSVDLRNAKVMVSVLGGGEVERRGVIRALLRRRVDLQSVIARNLGFKHTPKLTFSLDARMAEADRVLQILNEPETPESADER